MLASLSRLVPGHAATKFAIVPCSIQSETINRARADFFAPINCNRFGCLNCFHRTTSRQNLCPALVRTSGGCVERNGNEQSHLLQAGKISRVEPQSLDRDPGAAIYTVPYICAGTSPTRVVSDPPQLICYPIRRWQLPVHKAHLPEHNGKPLLVVGTQRRILPRTLADVSRFQCNKAASRSPVLGHLSPRSLARPIGHTVILVRFWKTTRV